VQKFFVSRATTNGLHWLHVHLQGRPSNSTGIGARLYATIHADTPQERTLRRDANANAGTFNQNDLPVHFGLGTAAVVDALRIVWPDRTEQVLHNVTADQHLTITIPTRPVPVVTPVGLTLLLSAFALCGILMRRNVRIAHA
jgi:hypothetical protein